MILFPRSSVKRVAIILVLFVGNLRHCVICNTLVFGGDDARCDVCRFKCQDCGLYLKSSSSIFRRGRCQDCINAESSHILTLDIPVFHLSSPPTSITEDPDLNTPPCSPRPDTVEPSHRSDADSTPKCIICLNDFVGDSDQFLCAVCSSDLADVSLDDLIIPPSPSLETEIKGTT